MHTVKICEGNEAALSTISSFRAKRIKKKKKPVKQSCYFPASRFYVGCGTTGCTFQQELKAANINSVVCLA